MGLDMYLTGNKFFMTDWQNPENNRTEDGFKVRSHDLELGYWRKHANLHGYLVATLMNGVDECQEINLSAEEMRQIIADIKARNLPPTTGFFFGASASLAHDGQEAVDAEIAEDVAIFEKAIAWLETKAEGEWRSVHYRASW